VGRLFAHCLQYQKQQMYGLISGWVKRELPTLVSTGFGYSRLCQLPAATTTTISAIIATTISASQGVG